MRILVRDAATIPESIRDKVEVITGDATKYEDVERSLEGQDRVVVVLGTRNKLDPTTIMSEGMQNIAKAMQKLGLKKVSICLSSFMFMDPEKVPKIMLNVHSDHERMFDIVKQSDLEWIAVCPPHISCKWRDKIGSVLLIILTTRMFFFRDNQPLSLLYCTIFIFDYSLVSADTVGEFKVEHEKSISRMVSKRHLGEFLVDCLDQDEHIHKRIGVATLVAA